MAQRPGALAPDSLDAELAEEAVEAAPAAAVTSSQSASSSSQAAPAASSTDGAAAEPQRRPRVAVASIGTQADEEPEGWQAFSLGRAL